MVPPAVMGSCPNRGDAGPRVRKPAAVTLPRIRSGLVVTGGFDPNDLNEIVGVDAEVRRAGEPLRGGRTCTTKAAPGRT
jgi:hypothetical protein